MMQASYYKSPIGTLLIAVQNNSLVGVWIENQKYYLANRKEEIIISDDDFMIIRTKDWLDRYFRGEKPDIKELDITLSGSDFRKLVWKKLMEIPYGTLTTYSEIAKVVAQEKNVQNMSAQAVGGAIGHNPISIIIPCHRVVGVNGSLTGYAGGIEKKIYLLEHEKVNTKTLFVPKPKERTCHAKKIK